MGKPTADVTILAGHIEQTFGPEIFVNNFTTTEHADIYAIIDCVRIYPPRDGAADSIALLVGLQTNSVRHAYGSIMLLSAPKPTTIWLVLSPKFY